MEPLGFYSKKLTDPQRKYSTYDRELVAIYQGIKHFSYMLEEREFCIWTDHRPLIFAFKQNPDKASPRQCRQLDYIGQFSTDIRHIAGKDNIMADTLSRINAIQKTDQPIDFKAIARDQDTDEEIQKLIETSRNGTNSMIFKTWPIPDCDATILCDTASGKIRPLAPKQFRNAILRKLHNISHQGTRGTACMVCERYVWPNMRKDAINFARTCIPCQKSATQQSTVGDFHTDFFLRKGRYSNQPLPWEIFSSLYYFHTK